MRARGETDGGRAGGEGAAMGKSAGDDHGECDGCPSAWDYHASANTPTAYRRLRPPATWPRRGQAGHATRRASTGAQYESQHPSKQFRQVATR
jgi:hypothetical protein